MHRRTDFLDIIKQNTDDPQCGKLIYELGEYYRIYDIDNNSFYGEIFNALYVESHQTYDDISAIYCVALCTIYRLRARFNSLAKMIAPRELKERYESFTN